MENLSLVAQKVLGPGKVDKFEGKSELLWDFL